MRAWRMHMQGKTFHPVTVLLQRAGAVLAFHVIFRVGSDVDHVVYPQDGDGRLHSKLHPHAQTVQF